METEKKFKARTFVTFTLLFSSLILAFSGIVLYIRPEGSIAKWVGWSFIGLDKKGWEGLHAVYAVFFIILALFHISYNWKVLIHYLKRHISKSIKLRNEFISSLVIILLLSLAVVMRWRPFWKIAEWRSTLKKSDAHFKTKPPISDFAEKKLSEVAQALHLSTEELMGKMRQLKLVIDSPNDNLADVAGRNKSTPEEIYMLLRY